VQNKKITQKILNEFSAISAGEEPGEDVLEKIKNNLNNSNNLNKEKSVIMKKTTIRRSFGTVAAAVIMLMIITTTAFAAWYLLNPSEVAEELGNSKLSAAFAGENAININAAQTAGDYKFTLMSIVSGNDISDSRFYRDGEIAKGSTYAVLAIQKADGSPMLFEELAAGDYGFRVGPLVKGYAPWQVFFARGGSATIVDGVLYYLIDSADISVFADKGVYLHVSTGFPGSGVIIFNEETGELSPNPDFDGINILFDLPLDVSLADPVRAQQYLDDLSYGE